MTELVNHGIGLDQELGSLSIVPPFRLLSGPIFDVCICFSYHLKACTLQNLPFNSYP